MPTNRLTVPLAALALALAAPAQASAAVIPDDAKDAEVAPVQGSAVVQDKSGENPMGHYRLQGENGGRAQRWTLYQQDLVFSSKHFQGRDGKNYPVEQILWDQRPAAFTIIRHKSPQATPRITYFNKEGVRTHMDISDALEYQGFSAKLTGLRKTETGFLLSYDGRENKSSPLFRDVYKVAVANPEMISVAQINFDREGKLSTIALKSDPDALDALFQQPQIQAHPGFKAVAGDQAIMGAMAESLASGKQHFEIVFYEDNSVEVLRYADAEDRIGSTFFEIIGGRIVNRHAEAQQAAG